MGSTPGTDAHGQHPHPHLHGSLDNPDVAHEHSDISIRAIVLFLAMLVVVVVVTDIAMWGLLKGLQSIERSNDPFVTPLAAAPGQLPAEPRLQTTPWVDLRQFREDELKRLHAYGWVDQKAGVGHLPIERAKELLLERGLKSRTDVLPDPSEGTNIAASGEAAGGHNIRVTGATKTTKAPGGAEK